MGVDSKFVNPVQSSARLPAIFLFLTVLHHSLIFYFLFFYSSLILYFFGYTIMEISNKKKIIMIRTYMKNLVGEKLINREKKFITSKY